MRSQVVAYNFLVQKWTLCWLDHLLSQLILHDSEIFVLLTQTCKWQIGFAQEWTAAFIEFYFYREYIVPLILAKWTQFVFRSTVSRDITLFFRFSNSFYFSFQVRFNMLTLKEKKGTIVFLSVTSVILSKKRSVLIWFPWFHLTQLISNYDDCFSNYFPSYFCPLFIP